MFKQRATFISKELRLGLYSLSGLVFIILFLVISGCMLWLIPGEYNIPDTGYASMSSFFGLAPVLLLFLIPALSMHSFAEEKKLHTLLLLRSRPVSISTIVYAKITALFILILIAIIPTLVYVFFLYQYGNPAGNIDLGAVTASYLGLLFVIMAFLSISVFASAITSNQVIALITGLFLCAFFYFGFNLISLDSLGFLSHYQSIQRGLIETRDLFYFLAVGGFFYYLTIFANNPSKSPLKGRLWGIAIILFIIAGLCFNLRFDCTKDKKYTLGTQIPALLKKTNAAITIEIYLTGNLNPGFTRLQQSTLLLLKDINSLSSQKIDFQLIDPYRNGKDFIPQLEKEGIKGIAVNERLSDGQISRNVVFPFLLVKYNDRKLPVSLLVNQPGKSGEENLNTSIELLEYRLAHAFRLLTQTDSQRILFLEGHGEWNDEDLAEIMDYLSYEYTIDRGVLSDDSPALDKYDLIIIAGPQSPFSEQDKFIIDQYLMRGGSLLWFVNGVQLRSYDELAQQGETISIANDLNLGDLFFTYGLRINPVVLQDSQCLNIPIVRNDTLNHTDYIEKPWYYAPLLQVNEQSEITKGLSFVKTEFASTLSLVGDRPSIRKEILLTSSRLAHSVPVPARISLEETDRQPDKNYFNESQLPVAVLLSGTFPSVFNNRVIRSQENKHFLSESKPTQLILAASEEIIRSGYDRYSQTQFANRELVLNMVNHLTDNEKIGQLKNKNLQIQLLNKQQLQQNQMKIILFNIILPPSIILVLFVILSTIRTGKYKRKTVK